MRNSKLIDIDLTGAQMLDCDLSGAHLENALMEGVTLRDSDLEGSRFISCNLRDTDMRKTNLTLASFESVKTEGTLYYGKAPWSGVSQDEGLGGELHTFDGE